MEGKNDVLFHSGLGMLESNPAVVFDSARTFPWIGPDGDVLEL